MQLVLVPASSALVLSQGKTDLQQLKLTCSRIPVFLSHIRKSSQNIFTHWQSDNAGGCKSVRDLLPFMVGTREEGNTEDLSEEGIKDEHISWSVETY